MLRRFSLYGFLKNQRYFEEFILLAFLAKGISFTTWGLLVGFREVMINLLEVPSGAVADLFGRRRSMILSFVAYIISFAIFGAARHVSLLFVGMGFFAVGAAFRTGTHKAMIFTWLRLQGRTHEKVRTYGYTRSWSQIGSALCVIIAAVLVFTTSSFEYIFYFSIIPYVLGIINFLGYPKELEGDITPGRRVSVADVASHLKEALLASVKKPGARRLMLESMGWTGVFKAAKDYIQPVLKASAVAWLGTVVLTEDLSKQQQTALLVGPVFFLLYLLSAAASRNAHRLVDQPGGEDRSARFLWALSLAAFVALIPSAFCGSHILLIVGFAVLYVMQNIWRPVLISRFDTHSDHAQKATILSVESQAGSLCTAVVAPLLGVTIDFVKSREACMEGGEFWPIGVLGAAVALYFFLSAKRAFPGEAAPADDEGAG